MRQTKQQIATERGTGRYTKQPRPTRIKFDLCEPSFPVDAEKKHGPNDENACHPAGLVRDSNSTQCHSDILSPRIGPLGSNPLLRHQCASYFVCDRVLPAMGLAVMCAWISLYIPYMRLLLSGDGATLSLVIR